MSVSIFNCLNLMYALYKERIQQLGIVSGASLSKMLAVLTDYLMIIAEDPYSVVTYGHWSYQIDVMVSPFLLVFLILGEIGLIYLQREIVIVIIMSMAVHLTAGVSEQLRADKHQIIRPHT